MLKEVVLVDSLFLITSMVSAIVKGMEPVLIGSLLAFLGLMLGSFAGAQVWRLRARQLVEDVREGEVVDAQEYDALLPLTKNTLSSDRSRCLQCSQTLAWYDLLPLVGWLSTAGKCRYCKAPIGKFEPLMEIGVSVVFVLSYLLWPSSLDTVIGVMSFAAWLVAVVLLAILFAYDFKWFLLPDSIVFPLISIGVVLSGVKVLTATDTPSALMSVGGAVLALSGLYFLLYQFSKWRYGEERTWVGFGDVKLGLGLALLLADWRLALLALFLANLIGSVAVVPGMLLGKLSRKAHVPFGPLLIAGAVIAMLVGERLIDLYLNLTF